jgi:hypothetical protein
MTRGRPYRPPLPRGQAVDELRRDSGRHFDPEVVEAFLRAPGAAGGRVMKAKGKKPEPNPAEIKLKMELDRALQEVRKLKSEMHRKAPAAAAPAGTPAAAAPAAAPATAAPAPAVPAAAALPPVTRRRLRPLPPQATAASAASALVRATEAAELDGFRSEMKELQSAKQRLSKLYFRQVEEGRKRAQLLQLLLEDICAIRSCPRSRHGAREARPRP